MYSCEYIKQEKTSIARKTYRVKYKGCSKGRSCNIQSYLTLDPETESCIAIYPNSFDTTLYLQIVSCY